MKHSKLHWLYKLTRVHYIHHTRFSFGWYITWLGIVYFKEGKLNWSTNKFVGAWKCMKNISEEYHNCTKLNKY